MFLGYDMRISLPSPPARRMSTIERTHDTMAAVTEAAAPTTATSSKYSQEKEHVLDRPIIMYIWDPKSFIEHHAYRY